MQSCMTSGDWHPIHADKVYAASTSLGQRVFHGTYGVHVAVGMAVGFPNLGNDVIGALGLAEWMYEHPLYVGDTVHVEVEITALRRTSDGARGVLERRIRLINQHGQAVQQGLLRSLVKAAQSNAKDTT